MTRWLPIPGWDFYEVSDKGEVRSLDRYVPAKLGTQLKRGRVLKPNRTTGYSTVRLREGSKDKTRKIHQLVLEAFVGPRPSELEGCHRDGNTENNSLENLYWGTSSQNNLDRVKHGTHHNANKLKCPEGHEYDYTAPDGSRRCKRCRAKRLREFRERNKNGAYR